MGVRTIMTNHLLPVAMLCTLSSIAALLCSCRPTTPKEPRGGAERLRVCVSIPPQKYTVRRIGGEHVDVDVLLSPGQSPATYEPTPKEMVRLGRCRLFLRIGVPFEEQVVNKIATTMGNIKVVDTCEGIKLRPGEPCRGHEHNGSHGHHHHEHDPHTWMDPRLAKVQAGVVCRALCEADPAHREDYQRAHERLAADLDRVHERIAADLAPLRGKEFYVFHPALGYFAEAYGLRQIAIEAGGRQPSAKQLSSLIGRAKSSGAKLIFVQPQFDKRSAELVAKEIGGTVAILDPLAEDYLGNLAQVASQIGAALGGVSSTRPQADGK